MVYISLIHFQIRRTQTILCFYNIGIESNLIAEYLVDPDNNLKLEDESRYRYENQYKSKKTQSTFNPVEITIKKNKHIIIRTQTQPKHNPKTTQTQPKHNLFFYGEI